MGNSDLTFVKYQFEDHSESMKGEHIMVKLTVPQSNWEIVNGKTFYIYDILLVIVQDTINMNQYIAKINFEEKSAELRKISMVSGQGVFVYGSVDEMSTRDISWLSNNAVSSQFFNSGKDYDEHGYMYSLEERFKS